MAKQWTRKQYFERVEQIIQKYEPLMLAWRGLSCRLSHEERQALRFSKLQQRVQGLETGMEIIRYQAKRHEAIMVLESQIAESSAQFLPHFLEAVQMILDDMKTDVVAPLTLALL